ATSRRKTSSRNCPFSSQGTQHVVSRQEGKRFMRSSEWLVSSHTRQLTRPVRRLLHCFQEDVMVYLSRIYTRSGDQGETGLGDGSRVRKDHPRVTAYGRVDELNAVLGLVIAHDPHGAET